MKRLTTSLLLLVLGTGILIAENIEKENVLSLEPRAVFSYDLSDATPFSHLIGLNFAYTARRFSLIADMYIANDGKYSPLESNQEGGTFFDYYAFLNTGGLIWRPEDFLTIKAGRFEHRDQLDGPYSLFVSSAAPSALLMELRFENDFFFYESRWVELNNSSAMFTSAYPDPEDDPNDLDGVTYDGPFPNRGMNVKAYGFKFGRMSFGLQDAAVYVGRSFDYEYFLSPLPQYFTQYVKGTLGRPWTTDNNENNLIGAFWKWDWTDEVQFDAQYLLDDFNMYALGIGPNNPWKAAWAFRAKVKTTFGNFAFSHAGAYKYTFEPTRDLAEEAYSYTYYPDSRFTIDDLSDTAVAFDDLMIGYKHGENNIAFRLDYDREWKDLIVASYLEFVLSGAKSPTNAWHDDDWHDYEGGRLLDDDLLEKKFLLSVGASKRFGGLNLMGSLLVGYAFNALELVDPDTSYTVKEKYQTINDNSAIWKPGSGGEAIFAASLGVRYSIPVMGLFKR